MLGMENTTPIAARHNLLWKAVKKRRLLPGVAEVVAEGQQVGEAMFVVARTAGYELLRHGIITGDDCIEVISCKGPMTGVSGSGNRQTVGWERREIVA